MTLNQLIAGRKRWEAAIARRARRRGRQQQRRVVPTPSVQFVDLVPYLQARTLLVKGRVESTSQPPSTHKTLIYFLRVTFLDPDRDADLIARVGAKPISAREGVVYAVSPNADVNPVQVYCDCPDYYFTWWYYNKQAGAHFGRPLRPYVRKTSDWPPRNPVEVPGLCKHILALAEYLDGVGWLQGLKR